MDMSQFPEKPRPDSETPDNSAVLMVRTRGWLCTLSCKFVIEVMRQLPIAPVSGAPPFVLGMSIVRGEVTPVVSLGMLLGSDDRVMPERFVLVRVGERRAVLGVDEIVGVDIIEQKGLDQAPGLLSEVLPGDVARIGVLDRSVLVMLETSRLLSDDTWRAMTAQDVAES